MSQRKEIRTLSRQEVYRNPWMRLYEDRIERLSGQQGLYGVVEKDDCAIILPVEGDSVYLVEQYRYTIGERCLEFPQGGWETPEVNPEELARGELREETGLLAGQMLRLGMQWIAYGFTRQRQFVYLATELAEGKTDPDPEEEDLVRHKVRIADFEQMLLDGTIQDASTLGAWGLYRLWRERQ